MAVILLTAACTNARSANIQETNNKLCAFSLEGDIATGDYDKLFDVIRRNRNRIDPYDERTGTICLKSVGGSYVEALKIAEFISTHAISTLIEYGSQCFSACAIIFIAGVVSDGHGPIMPYRKLSAGGILGFHAPYLSMPDEKYSKEQVEDIGQSMRRAILALVELSSKRTQLGGDFLKKSLIYKILDKGPQDVFFVKKISEAARWDILIYDAADNFRIDYKIDGLKNICNNFHYSNMDEAVPQNTNLSVQVEKYSSKFYKDDFRILVRDGRTSDIVCELHAGQSKTDHTVSFRACSFDYWSHRSFGDCREYKTAPKIRIGKFVPDFFALDPETLLKKFMN
jgi:hypothetical protein